jgi:ABC-type oligopeptide transport system substrate-binding subunit
MKKMKFLSVLIIFALSVFIFTGCGGSSSSDDSSSADEATVYSQDFTVVNETGIEVYALFVSPTGEASWGDDILTTDTLPTGSSTDIVFDTEVEEQYWDLMIADSAGTTVEWSNIDLFTVSEITLKIENGNPTATFK